MFEKKKSYKQKKLADLKPDHLGVIEIFMLDLCIQKVY